MIMRRDFTAQKNSLYQSKLISGVFFRYRKQLFTPFNTSQKGGGISYSQTTQGFNFYKP